MMFKCPRTKRIEILNYDPNVGVTPHYDGLQSDLTKFQAHDQIQRADVRTPNHDPFMYDSHFLPLLNYNPGVIIWSIFLSL